MLIPHNDAMTTHFTADTHFGHESIIAMSARPFSNVEEMNEAMIANWNAVVATGDNVWHVGDFAHRCDLKRKRSIFSRLNGSKHLVPGNHDDNDTLSLGWASIGQIRQIVVDGQRLVLCHYGMRTWPGSRRGALHLYGHSHGTLPGNSQSLDVGVDCWSFRPVTLADIKEVLEREPSAGMVP
jgi:calcineurin-like phosphoesterase family protein